MSRKQRRIEKRATKLAVPKVVVNYKGILDVDFGTLPETNVSVNKCYASSLGSCAGELSREHYISENILEKFSGIKPEGIPWMAHREELIGPNDLTVKCLCEKHNNYLSPLDKVAGAVFDSFLNFPANTPEIANYSGRLFERWCLKVLYGVLATKRIKINDQVITTDKLGKPWLDVLFFGKELPNETGLYCYYVPGNRVDVATKVGIQTLVLNDELQGIKINVSGFEFYFTLCEKEVGFNIHHPNFAYVMRRPKSYSKANYPQKINFKWDRVRS